MFVIQTGNWHTNHNNRSLTTPTSKLFPDRARYLLIKHIRSSPIVRVTPLFLFSVNNPMTFHYLRESGVQITGMRNPGHQTKGDAPHTRNRKAHHHTCISLVIQDRFQRDGRIREAKRKRRTCPIVSFLLERKSLVVSVTKGETINTRTTSIIILVQTLEAIQFLVLPTDTVILEVISTAGMREAVKDGIRGTEDTIGRDHLIEGDAIKAILANNHLEVTIDMIGI